jgi:formylglycine-generating enzyme required for sulfatase activity
MRTLLLFCCLLLIATSAHGAKTSPAALEAPQDHAEARGVVALRLPLEGRVRVVGATFRMGSTSLDMERARGLCHKEILGARCDDPRVANGFRPEGHQHDVTVFTFDLDRTEVTVRAYARCVEAGVCSPPGYPPGDPRFDRPTLPVTHVRWDDAAQFCAWIGGRLPTEAEWELAARGTERREFPWGWFYNAHVANHGALAPDETDASDGFLGLAPVGSFPDGATPLGLLDMAGNAAEWVFDLWDVDENGFGYPQASQVNPKGPSAGGTHVIRGGSFEDGAPWMRGASRATLVVARSPSVGFRCAHDP